MYSSADSSSSCSSNLSVALRPRMRGFSEVTSHAKLEVTLTTRPPAGMSGENVSNIYLSSATCSSVTLPFHVSLTLSWP